MNKNLSYNHTTFPQRLNASAKHLARAKKLGLSNAVGVLGTTNFWQKLANNKPLDGLTLYRQSLARIVIPRYIHASGGRTILLISQR